MSTHPKVEKIVVILLVLLFGGVLFLFLWKWPSADISVGDSTYTHTLFDTGRVHTIDLAVDDWDGFLETCEAEEYVMCDAVIDGEVCQSIGLRAKGNSSLTSVSAYDNNRYSFKLEFDHYRDGATFQGLDKLNLNNIIQDNTYMKDYLAYQLMADFGVVAPLCSYVWITVNGEDWGLYLAVEGLEESFLARNYDGKGKLYKPDSMDMGAMSRNGEKPEMPEDFNPNDAGEATPPSGEAGQQGMPEMPEMPEGFPGRMAGNDDVALRYTDDSFESYRNIFDNAVTEVTDTDKSRLIASLKTLNSGENIPDVVDTDAVIRYFVVHNFLCNFDSYTGSLFHNYYLYERDGVLSMLPWDYNLLFSWFQGGGDTDSLLNFPIATPVQSGTVEERPMLAWIFADDVFLAQYHDAFDSFLANWLENGTVERELTRVRDMIAPYVEKDPTKFCTYEEFQTGAETLVTVCQLRAESVRGQLSGSIPSTADGQNAAPNSLVSTPQLSLSAMGSMGMGKGDGGFRGGERSTKQDLSSSAASPTPPADPETSARETAGVENAFPQRPEKGENGQREGQKAPDFGQGETKNASAVWILLGVSALFLIGGLIVVIRYRR